MGKQIIQCESLASLFERIVIAYGKDSIQGIADRLKISYQSVYRWGKGKYPAIDTLIEISKQTDVSLHWLLTGQGKKQIFSRRKLMAPLVDKIIKGSKVFHCRRMYDAMSALRITQVELSERVGLTQGALSHIQNGKRFPSIPVIDAIAKALSLNRDFLLEVAPKVPAQKPNPTRRPIFE